MTVLYAALGEILLMVFFGAVEVRGRFDLCRDGATKASGSFEFGFGRARGLFLFGRVEEDNGAILRADIGALPVYLGRIMGIPKHVE